MRAVVQCVSEASVTVEGQRGRGHWEGVRHSSGRGPRRHRGRGGAAVAQDRQDARFRRRPGQDEPELGRCGWGSARGEPVHAVRELPQGESSLVHRRGRASYRRRLYEHFAAMARADGFTVATGEFGAMMDVALVNHGPFTVVLDTDAL